jgi:hypothetical protein
MLNKNLMLQLLKRSGASKAPRQLQRHMSSLGNGGSPQLKEAVGADYSVSEKDYLLQFSK